MSRRALRAPIALTPGEPAGIGPDILLELAESGLDLPLVAIADPALLDARARLLGRRVVLEEVGEHLPRTPSDRGRLWVKALPLASIPAPGAPDPANARALLAALDEAVAGCLKGRYAAMVTGPLSKAAINDAGIAFSGHTEYLATRCGEGHPVMMLAARGLRVALVTTHLPLRAVSDAVDAVTLERVLRVVDHDLRTRFGLPAPRILVLGLNPHAGEGGHLGREEADVIGPVLVRLRREGLALTGPVPADTAFNPARLADTDIVVAMYHDQGLPVLKHASFGLAVNITLGLPLIRTSVDHGTAFDVAGTGRADARSLREALAVAARMAARESAQ